ncbi:MAG: hypothetical protein QM504_15305 [Pseudomonadota bacterium]
MYKNEFEDSVERTKRIGLEGITCIYQDNLIIPQDNAKLLSDVFTSIIGCMESRDLIAKCISVHHQLLKPLNSTLNTKAIYTIGYIETNGKNIYKKSEEELISIMNTDIRNCSVLNIHAWITLPSMEILDFTIATTMAFVKNMPNINGAIFHGHADKFDDTFKYHPMLVGDGFLRKMGLIH